MTTFVLTPKKHIKDNHRLTCYYCGEPADVLLEATSAEPETGYNDSIELCRGCFEKEIANKLDES